MQTSLTLNNFLDFAIILHKCSNIIHFNFNFLLFSVYVRKEFQHFLPVSLSLGFNQESTHKRVSRLLKKLTLTKVPS